MVYTLVTPSFSAILDCMDVSRIIAASNSAPCAHSVAQPPSPSGVRFFSIRVHFVLR